VPIGLSDEQLLQEISTSYPFPVAFSLRRFDNSPYLDEKLRCVENTLAFLGSLGVAIAGHCGLSLRAGGDLRKLDLAKCWDRGITIGEWRDIIRETTLGLMRLGEAETPVPQFPYFYWKRVRGKHTSETAHLIEELPRIRNDLAHGRHPTSESERAQLVAQLRDKMFAILKSVRFLRDYPLWCVADAERQRGEPLIQVAYRSCTGDNPEFEVRQGQCEELPFKNTLYLRADDVMVDLTPWLVLRTCPRCGADAIFYVERIDQGRRMVTYKSFNRGHQEETADHWTPVSEQLAL
jgi:hypothetical protein